MSFVLVLIENYLSVRFPVESGNRKRKGVSRFHDPSRGQERRHAMTVSLKGRVALQELMVQAWQQVEGQARGMLKRAVEGLLQAERDRRVAEAQQRGEKVYRWGYTVRKCWTTLWGSLEQVRVPRLRGREEIGLIERYERHGLDEMLFALTVGGLSQRKVAGWVGRLLGGQLSAASIGGLLQPAPEAGVTLSHPGIR